MTSRLGVACMDTLSSSRWWRQQSWRITTEVLMGFLAAWGFGLGLGAAKVGLGLALVYLVSSLGMVLSRYHGWQAGLALLCLGVGSGLLAILFDSAQWIGLCVATGVLLFFRDHQTAEMLAWLPVRAHRRGMTNHDAIRITTVLSALVLVASLTAAGFISRAWPWLPYAIVLLALVRLVPRQIKTMGSPQRGVPPFHSGKAKLVCHPTQQWLLRLVMIFNSANFLGRRLLLPAALLMIASNMGYPDKALPILGASLGLMGLVGALARPPKRFARHFGAYELLRWGARLTLVGWIGLAAGVFAWTTSASAWSIPLIMSGWVLLELTNKTWGVAYMEFLRQSCSGTRALATRPHRLALSRFMVHKAAGGAFGLGLASLVPVSWIPALTVSLALAAFVALEKSPVRPAQTSEEPVTTPPPPHARSS